MLLHAYLVTSFLRGSCCHSHSFQGVLRASVVVISVDAGVIAMLQQKWTHLKAVETADMGPTSPRYVVTALDSCRMPFAFLQ
ncbi:hypothetical protein MRX96_044699 [Rhipicephalus microplus]